MVLVEVAEVRGPFNLRIRKTRGERYREKRSSLDVMILLYVINVARGILASVLDRDCATNVNS